MITIRDARIGDAEIITQFSANLAYETEEITLDRDRLFAGIQALLRDPIKGRYFLAEIADQIVGQTSVTYEWSDWRNGMWWWIQSVYIPAAFRKKGVYRALHQHILEQAQQAGAVGLRLYVEKENRAAQSTYHRVGMKECQYQLFEQGFQVFW